MSEVQERLIVLAKALNISPNQFSLSIGRDRSYVKKITKEIQTDALRSIFNTYPNVNLVWIITGKGDIFIKEDSDNALLQHYMSENAELKEKIYDLNKEIGRLELMNELSKKSVQQVDNAECADVKPTGSDNL